MSQRHKKKGRTALLSVGLLFALISPNLAFASILFSQPTSSTPDTAVWCMYENGFASLPEIALTYAGPSSAVGYLSFIGKASTTQQVEVHIVQYTAPDFVTQVASAYVYETITGVKGRVDVDFSTSGMWLNSTSTYRILIEPKDGIGSIQFYGVDTTRTDLYPKLTGPGGSWGSHCTADFGMPWLEIGTDGPGEFFDPEAFTSPAAFRDCGLTDISGCIANAFSWAFMPSVPLATTVGEFASSTSQKVPFGYVADVYDIYDTISGYATTSLSLTVELSPILNWLGASYSSTTMTVISSTAMRSLMGPTLWTIFQSILRGFLWFTFFAYVYHRARKFL